VCEKSPNAEMSDIAIAVAPLLLSDSVCVPVVSTIVSPNVRFGGESATVPMPPLPDNGTICGLSGASSVNVRVPLRAPMPLGVNVTLTVQPAPGASDPPQPFDWANSPVVATLDMVTAADPLLRSVSDCAALVVPTSCAPKVNDDTARVSAGPVDV